MLYKFSVRVCILLFKYIQSKKLLINTYKNAELRKCSFSCRIHDNDNKIIYFGESYVLASSGVCRLRQVSLIFRTPRQVDTKREKLSSSHFIHQKSQSSWRRDIFCNGTTANAWPIDLTLWQKSDFSLFDFDLPVNSKYSN